MQRLSKTPPWGVFSFICFLLGSFLSWGVLSGDAQGRVNLLLLILLYAVVPLVSLLVTFCLLIVRPDINLAVMMSRLRLWPDNLMQQWQLARLNPVNRWWLLSTSQWLLVAFSLGCLLTLMVALLFLDVNFIWRSTLLSAEILNTLLTWLAWPWSFWHEAQPSLELLTASQDNRLVGGFDDATRLQAWWKFVLACQLFYSLLPRTLVAAVSRLAWQFQVRGGKSSLTKRDPMPNSSSSTQLAPVVHSPEGSLVLVNWAGFPEPLVEDIKKLWRDQIEDSFPAGPLATLVEQQVAERWRGPQLILVKAWEPPLAELGDYMENASGYLCPLELSQDQLRQPDADSLTEWRRFCHAFAAWQVLLPGDLPLSQSADARMAEDK